MQRYRRVLRVLVGDSSLLNGFLIADSVRFNYGFVYKSSPFAESSTSRELVLGLRIYQPLQRLRGWRAAQMRTSLLFLCPFDWSTSLRPSIGNAGETISAGFL